jgi:hypothetical protein
MIDNLAISDDPKHSPFRDYKGASIADAWQDGFNPEYWRHCITISQGLVGVCRKRRPQGA